MPNQYINIRNLSSVLYKIVIFIPSLVLIGWQFNIESLKRFLPHHIAMNPLSCVLFILGGISLFLINEEKQPKSIKMGKNIGLTIAVIALIKMIDYTNMLDTGIDQVLFKNKLADNSIAPNTVFNFLLTGLALYLIDFKKRARYVPSQILGLLAFVISLLAIIGYMYVSNTLYKFSSYKPMAIHTAITFVFLTMGILLARYQYGLIGVITSKNTGGVIARKLIPVAIITPILVGWFRLEMQKLNLFPPAFNTALAAVLIISTMSVIVWIIAKSLNRMDVVRKEAELELIKAKAEDIIARKKVEVAEEMLRMATDSAELGTWFISSDTREFIPSPRLKEIFGYGANEEMPYEAAITQIVKDYQNIVTNAVEDPISKGEKYSLEYPVAGFRNSEVRWVKAVGKLNYDNDGKPSYFSGVLQDITERKLEEEGRKKEQLELIKTKNELAINELKYRNLIDNAGVSMFTSTLNGRFTFVNNKALQLTGYDRDELIGMSFTHIVDEKDIEKVLASYQTQLHNDIEETYIEFSILTKNGETKYIEQSAVIIKENNTPVGFHCVVKDITQKREMENVVKKYEDKLVKNQALLQSILDNATSLIFVKDLQGKYILVNKQFKEYLNVSEEIIGKTDFDFTDAQQAQRFKFTDDEVIRSGKSVELEETLETANGKQNILILKFPLLDAENKIYGISGIASDITERVKYQEQLLLAKKMAEEAQNLQEQFLANMSHEIRTPMNGIKGMTDLLMGTPLNDEQKDFTKTIQRSSDNLLVIINDILDLSKIQAGKLTIEKINFSLKVVLEDVMLIFKNTIEEKGLTLQLDVNADVPAILNGDPYRLNQILVNLIGNATKFTTKGGVDIKVSIEEKTAKDVILNFAITDTGIGIEKDKVDEIFDSFTQASMNTSRKYGGTGLGLSITRQLLELQGGKISVESKLNRGSTFKFSIPYTYSKADSSTQFIHKDSIEYRSLLNGKKFLVVEDNEINQKVVRHVLQQAGGVVEAANDGSVAVALLEKSIDYDAIIMDLQMPQMDGYETTAYIRNVMKLDIPIIAMTANALKGEREKCIEVGMDDYISKPFDFAFFYKRLGLLITEKAKNHSVEIIEKAHFDCSLYDLSLLEEMDDKEYIIEILSIFLKETPIDLDALIKACASNQFSEAYNIAHKLKSLGWLIKANCLTDVLIEIEEHALAKKTDGFVHLAEQAKEEYKNLEVPLQSHLKNIQGELEAIL